MEKYNLITLIKPYRKLIAILLLLAVSTGFLIIYVNIYNHSSRKNEHETVSAVENVNPPHEVKYIGHRGLSAIAPENTLPSFEEAGNHGMWGAECDVWETSDEQFVVCHNPTVNSTTDGEGKIIDKTLAELKDLKIDSGNNISEYDNLKIPTLEEYLDCCQKYNIVPVIEVKNIAASSIVRFVDVLKARRLEDKVTLLLSDYLRLNMIRTVSDVNIQFLLDKTLAADNYKIIFDTIAKVKNVDVDIYYPTAADYIVDYAHKLGLKVNVWTVDSPTKMYKLINMNVDYITTDIIVDDTKINQEPSQTLTINSSDSAKQLMTSNFSQKDSIDKVENVLNKGTYYYEQSNGVLSINSNGHGGIHSEFDCDVGDVISVEYEYYAIGATPKLKINGYSLTPTNLHSYHPQWESVKLSIPSKSKDICSVDITSYRGRYKLRNVTIKHIKCNKLPE